jgi:hypothetical protein
MFLLFWSALTCQRFDKRRLVAVFVCPGDDAAKARRRVGADQSGNKLPHSKLLRSQFFTLKTSSETPLSDDEGRANLRTD